MRCHRLSALALVVLALVLSCGEDDNAGPSNSNSNSNPTPTPNPSPTAAFGPACSLLGCTFSDSSTDDEAVTAWRWDFGDGTAPSMEENPAHTYATEAQYLVTLRVTDNEGATDSIVRGITVSESPECVDASTPEEFVPCRILIPDGNSVRVTISSESDCTAAGDTLRMGPPFNAEVFTDGCHTEKDAAIPLIGGNPFFGSPTVLYLAIILESDDPNRVAPSVHQEGGYPQWTIRLEDGGHPQDPNEPDFNDLVVTITATAPPPTSPWDYLRQLTQSQQLRR